MMMSLMRGMGGASGGIPMGMTGMGGMPMMDLSAAPVIDSNTFAKMAKLAALMGSSPATGKAASAANTKAAANAAVAKAANQLAKQKAAEQQSSGIDPMVLFMMSQQGGMDPMMLPLLMSSSKPSPSTPTSSGIDPMTMYFLMQVEIFYFV